MLMTEKSIQAGRFALYVALILFCMVKPASAQTKDLTPSR